MPAWSCPQWGSGVGLVLVPRRDLEGGVLPPIPLALAVQHSHPPGLYTHCYVSQGLEGPL